MTILFAYQLAQAQTPAPYSEPLSAHSYGSDKEAHTISLGTVTEPANNISSVSFSFNYNMDLGAVEFHEPTSWLAEGGSTSVTIDYISAEQLVTVTIERVTGGSKTGWGEIGHLTVDVVGITENVDIRRLPFATVASSTTTRTIPVSVFPQPARDHVYLRPEAPIQSLQLLDMQGKKVLETAGGIEELDLPQLEAGMYFLHGETEAGPFRERLVIQ